MRASQVFNYRPPEGKWLGQKPNLEIESAKVHAQTSGFSAWVAVFLGVCYGHGRWHEFEWRKRSLFL